MMCYYITLVLLASLTSVIGNLSKWHLLYQLEIRLIKQNPADRRKFLSE